MSAFVLFDIRDVTDPEKLGDYQAQVLETVDAHGGRYRVLGGSPTVIEGEWTIGTPVLIEFPSRHAAQKWYGSDAYRPLLKLRHDATEGTALLVDGCDHPPEALTTKR